MCEWSNTTLGQLVENGLAELQTGPFGTMLHASAYRANGIPVVAVKHIGDNQLIHSDMPRIDAETVARLRKYKLQANDILFARKGAVSRRALVKAQEEGWVQGSDCIRLRLDSNRINPAFVSYLLGTWAHRTWIEQHAHGATMPSLNQEILDLIPLVLPSKPYQDRIAHILGTLDDKIELNRRMNRTLEAIARAIFKSWFIDFDPIIDNAILNGKPIPDEFAKRAEVRREIIARSQPSPPSPLPEVEGRQSAPDAGPSEVNSSPSGRGGGEGVADYRHLFPDSFQDSPLGKIPKGWEAKPFSEIVEINPSRALRKGTTAPYVNMASLPTNGSQLESQPTVREYKSGSRFQNGDVLFARITPCLENRKTVLVDFLEDGVVAAGSTEFLVLGPNSAGSYFAYCASRWSTLREHAIASMTGTSGRQRVQREAFEHLKMAVPSRGILMAFEDMVKPLFLWQQRTCMESRSLARIRDILLPRLLSGEGIGGGEPW